MERTHKEASSESIWEEIVKQAGLVSKARGVILKARGTAKPLFSGKAKPTIKPSGGLDYAKMRADEIAKQRAKGGGTLSYSQGKPPVYTAPGKTMEESRAAAQAKVQSTDQKRMQHAMQGGYTDPQIRRHM